MKYKYFEDKYVKLLDILNMSNMLSCRLKEIDEARNYLLDETKHDLMSEKPKKVYRALN